MKNTKSKNLCSVKNILHNKMNVDSNLNAHILNLRSTRAL